MHVALGRGCALSRGKWAPLGQEDPNAAIVIHVWWGWWCWQVMEGVAPAVGWGEAYHFYSYVLSGGGTHQALCTEW